MSGDRRSPGRARESVSRVVDSLHQLWVLLVVRLAFVLLLVARLNQCGVHLCLLLLLSHLSTFLFPSQVLQRLACLAALRGGAPAGSPSRHAHQVGRAPRATIETNVTSVVVTSGRVRRPSKATGLLLSIISLHLRVNVLQVLLFIAHHELVPCLS